MEKNNIAWREKIHFANLGGEQSFQVKVAKWAKKLKWWTYLFLFYYFY